MKTNLSRWNYFLALIKEMEDAYMDTLYPSIPSEFYLVHPVGTYVKCTVLGRFYSNGLYFSGKKPSNNDVKKIEDYYQADHVYDDNKAYFDYSYVWNDNGGICSTAIHVKDVAANKRAFLNEDDAIKQAKVILSLREEELGFKKTHAKDAKYDYLANGYKFLGWQNGWHHVYFDEDHNLCSESGKPSKSFGYSTADYPEYGKCRDAKHRHIEVSHNQRGSENTVSCPECKIYWKYDCSD